MISSGLRWVPIGRGSEARVATYVEELTSVIGHADRVTPLAAYRTGERKNVDGGGNSAGTGFGPASIAVAFSSAGT
jgi:hypothetical protein